MTVTFMIYYKPQNSQSSFNKQINVKYRVYARKICFNALIYKKNNEFICSHENT